MSNDHVHPVMQWVLNSIAGKPDYTCKVCGIDCGSAPEPPARAVCPDHCEDHDYIYDRDERRHYCTHCGQDRPADYYDNE